MKTKSLMLLASAAIVMLSFTFISSSRNNAENDKAEANSLEAQRAPIGGNGAEEMTR